MSDEILGPATEAVGKIQTYDLRSLGRPDLPGINFGDAVAPAQRLVQLFSMIPLDGLKDLPRKSVEVVRVEADAILTRFNEFVTFDIANFNGNVPQWRDQKVGELRNVYDDHVQKLMPIVSFLSAKRTDFSAIENDARRATAAISAEKDELLQSLAQAKAEADEIKEAMKKAAAETGVTQEAVHFAKQADDHADAAKKWLRASIWVALLLAAYSAASIFLTRIPWIAPQNDYETVQLAVSKVLIFAVIAFMLVVCVRNFTANRHNAVVNKHRQNALLTYKAIASAAHTGDAQDVVLTHAAACIYAPQETAYSKTGGAPSNLVEIMPRITATPH